jgi:hypothetical protein
MYRFIILALLFSSIQLDAQPARFEHELGIQAGVANYYGDLNTQFGIKGIGPAISGFWRGNYGHRFALKASISHMKVSASDANSASVFQLQRNLSFHSSITDLNAQVEFNFLKYVKNVFYNEEGSKFTPYLSFGAGVFFFNPQADFKGKTYDLQPLGTEGQTDQSYTQLGRYNLYSLSLNYGGGFKYHVHRNLSVGLDFSIRRAFTDYLDDVSGNYVPVISLNDADKGIAYQLYDRSKELGPAIGAPGKQRGANNGNDDFATCMFSISWTFIKPFCPSEMY